MASRKTGSLYDMNHVDDVRHEVDNDVLAELMREGEDRRASEQRQRTLRHEQKSVRWRLFGAAVMFLTRVVVDLWRRGQQCVQHSMPRCITLVDRWIVQSVRSSIGPTRKMSALRLLLAMGLAFALSYIVRSIGRMRFPTGRPSRLK